MAVEDDASVIQLAFHFLGIDVDFGSLTAWPFLAQALAEIDGSDGTGCVLNPKDYQQVGDYILVGYGGQDSVLWGVREDLNFVDPPVSIAVNTKNAIWSPYFDSFSCFAAAFVIWKAVNTGNGIRGAVLENVAPIRNKLRALGLSRCPFASPAGVEVFSDGDSYLVCIGAKDLLAIASSEETWNDLDSIVELGWDYCSLDDD